DVVGATTTEADGHFAFFALAQGHYTLTVAAASLQPVASSVELPASGHVTRDVEVATRVQLIGVVRTATANAPVPEALTTLIAADGQVVASAITDVDGGFVFDDLNAGVYTVIATGYPPVAAEVHLGVGDPTETVITLGPPRLADAAAGNGAVRSAEREDADHGSD
ncbi:MAG: MSCRAMM family protein, partial [Pseudonocardiaceae bacterium]